MTKNDTCKRLLAAAAVLLAAAAMLHTLFVGLEIDEEYALSLGFRLVRGDRLFYSMWEPHQLSALPPALLIAAYTAVTGTTTGVLLFVRVTMLVLKAVLSVWFYRSLRAPLGRTSACLLALVLFVFTPKWFLGPDYVSQQFHFTLAAFLFFYGYYAPGPQQYRGLWRVAAGAVCACFSFLAYPQSAAAAPFLLLGLWLLLTWLVFTVRLRRSRRFLGRRGRVRIYAAGSISSPCLAGLIPAVYLTEDVVQTDAAELILRHELTHLRHLDPLWSFCRAAAVTVYWWNPFVWLAALISGRDAELACDEAVAAGLSDAQRLVYARAILAQAPRKAAALSLAGPPVKERILFLTKKQRTSVLCVVLALLLTVTATGCSFAELTARGEEPEAAHQEALKSVLKTDVSLTQEQIDAVNAVFADYELSTDDTLGHFAVNGFFTSTYEDVRELNLKEFLTYFGECGEEDISEEEFAQLKDKWADFKAERLEDFPLPIHRYPASAVEAVLQRFAGIGLADLKDIQEPFSGYTYLESTDAFYNTTSDYSPGYFTCTGGSIDAFGEYVQLFGWASRFPGESILRLEKDGENWYIKSFTLEIPADELPEEDPVPTMEPGYPLGLLLTQETAMRKDASDTAELCDGRPLQEGEYVQALTERTVDGQLWYLVECTPFDTPADTRGWVRADVTEPYTVRNMWSCTAPLYLVDGARYYDETGAHTLSDADPRGPYRITSYDEANYRYHLSGAGGSEIEIGGFDMIEFPPLPADDPETISYQVQQKLAHARWQQPMTADYEDQIRSFEGADYRDGWGVGQYPHYYKTLADFFVEFFQYRDVLEPDAVWSRDLAADGTVMRIDMQRGDTSVGLFYSIETHDLCVAPEGE